MAAGWPVQGPAIWVALAFCLWLCGMGAALGQGEKLTFGAGTRIRYEFQDGFNQKYYGDPPPRGIAEDGFFLARFQVGLDYYLSKRIHLAVQGQHADVWDMALPDDAYYNKQLEMEHNPNKDYWELADTYLEISKPLGTPVVFRAGRQRLAYGDKRTFGPGDWGNSGRWIWDAVKLSYKTKSGFFDTYYGRTMIHEPSQFSLKHRHFYESYGFYSQYKLLERFRSLVLEPFFMTKIDSHDKYTGEDGESGDLFTYYAGGRTHLKPIKGFDIDGTYVWQFGDYGSDDVEAQGYHLLVAYAVPTAPIAPRMAVEYTFGSGDSDPADGVHETFDAAFGSRAKMYGRMNLFQWSNLKDAQVSIEVNPAKSLYVKAEFHRFWLAEKRDGWYLNAKEYRDKSGESGTEVGREFDIVAAFDLPIAGKIEAGFGHFWPDEFAEKQASSEQATWVFLQWTTAFSYGAL